MKRYNNLYSNIWNISNIFKSYNEVSKNTRNKVRVSKLKAYKLVYVSKVNYTLKKKQYVTGPYNHFVIYEPKKRNIVSQQVEDKIVNHLVSRYILYPAILPCLLDVNVASRKDMGTSEGLRLAKDYHRKCKIKYNTYYILKCDISKFFASIDHNILKQKVLRRIKDKDSINIIFDIIDSNTSRAIYWIYDKSNTCHILPK